MTQYSYLRGKEKSLREEIVRIGRLMYDRGLTVSNDGNISARLDDEHIVVTLSGLCKGMMTPDQMIVVDMGGNKVGTVTAANRDLGPTSETPMHLEAYRQRSDVQAVVHAHPPLTVALSIAGVSFADCMLPEVIVNLGIVPTTEYATPASKENVGAIRDLIKGHDGMILQRHGTLTVGRSLLEAYMRLETLEQIAQIRLVLQLLGKGEPLAPTQVTKLLGNRKKLGLWHESDAEAFCEACDVCLVDEPPAPAVQPASTSSGIQEEELVRIVTEAVLRELSQNG
jgi:L-fuculose-phosphate aldolase